jgi:predicted nicotinamide N-methyase
MNRKTVLEFGSDTALIAAAFFVRNAVVLTGLSVFVLIALAR